MEFLPLAFLLILLFAFALRWLARRERQQTGMPNYARVIYSDTGAWRKMDKPLFSKRLSLTGKPDYLVELEGETIPIEVKPNRVAHEPYLSDTLQLMAYGLLVEEEFGARPSHGLLKYRDEIFRVEFTDDLRAELFAVLDAMRANLDAQDVARSHDEPARCRVCGYREGCEQALES